MNYEFSAIEAKWHKYWEENDTFHTDVWDFSDLDFENGKYPKLK